MKNAPGSWIAVSLPVLPSRFFPPDAGFLGRKTKDASRLAFEDFLHLWKHGPLITLKHDISSYFWQRNKESPRFMKP